MLAITRRQTVRWHRHHPAFLPANSLRTLLTTRHLTIDDIESLADAKQANVSVASVIPPLPSLAPVLVDRADADIATIYQFASGFGVRSLNSAVGVAIVRVSGPAAVAAYHILTRSTRRPPARTSSMCVLYHPSDGAVIDAPAIAVVFDAPKSFTGENVVEFHVHGTPLIVTHLMDALSLVRAGAIVRGEVSSVPRPLLMREAVAGEFTRRAFDNGKLDLSQVEALADLLSAQTEQQHRQAIRQLSGRASAVYEKWRTVLLTALAHVEAVIDFGDDEPDIAERDILNRVVPATRDLRSEIELHLSDGRRGELVREGVSVVIIGAPNVGKSSLLNCISERDVAIVSPIAGTTRDTIDVALNLGGFNVRLTDTAGVHQTRDEVELEGIKRTRSKTDEATIKLALFDSTNSGDGDDDGRRDEILRFVDENTIIVLTKADLIEAASSAVTTASAPDTITSSRLNKRYDRLTNHSSAPPMMKSAADTEASIASRLRLLCRPRPIAFLLVSSANGFGMRKLIEQIEFAVKERLLRADSDGGGDETLITRRRHRECLNDVSSLLAAFDEAIRQSDLVFAAEHARRAVRAIGRLTGRVDVEDLLDVIFADFCIGK